MATLALALATNPGFAVASNDAGLPDIAHVCVAPVVPTPARCTFDVYGSVRDSTGELMSHATITQGSSVQKTNTAGFYDLFEAQPGEYDFLVRITNICFKHVHVTVDSISAIQQGGVRMNVRLPCTMPMYHSFGFGVVQSGKLLAVARSGLRHSGSPGDIELFGLDGRHRLEPIPVASDQFDDRDAAGGLTSTGALVTFYARFDITKNRWSAIGYVRTTKDGSEFGSIPEGANIAFSPYGPLVVLPSGKLLQTFYGSDGHTWRIYTAFSTDDGRNWSRLIPIDVAPPFIAQEASATYLDGATDDTSRILMVTRAKGGVRPNRWSAIVEYLSNNGGRSWIRLGRVARTISKLEIIPWIGTLSHGKVVVVWIDRGSMTLKRSISSYQDAIEKNWAESVVLYRSKVPRSPWPNIGDFGYPSIVTYGPNDWQRGIVFSDVNPSACSDHLSQVDLLTIPLWPAPNQEPALISPST